MGTNQYNSKTTISTKRIIFYTILWAFTMMTFIILMTNFFTESPFTKKYLAFFMGIFVATIGIIKLHNRYWKSKKKSMS